jgi:4-amino-4-deoxy-L-arabinose transferase-like glycosyltransferase
LQNLGILLAVFLLLSLPCLGKPLNSDDPLYVWAARHITSQPAHFFSFAVNWEGHRQPFDEFFQNPPLPSYFLAVAWRLVGWNESGLHASFELFNLAGLVAVFLLARLCCRRPLLTSLIVLLCPVLMVSSTTLMCEPPLFCFWTWAVYLWIRGCRGSPALVLLSGLLIAAAVFSKYSAICLFPLLIAHAVLFRSPSRVRISQFFALLFAVATLAGYEAWYSHLYGHGALANAIGYSTRVHTRVPIPAIIRLTNTSAFVGGGFTAASLVALFSLRRRWIFLSILSAIVLAVTACLFLQPPPGWLSAPALGQLPPSAADGFPFFLQYSLMTTTGLVLLGCCVHRFVTAARTDEWRTDLFLLLWAGGVFVFAACLNWSINARSILPMLVPVALLIVRSLDCDADPARPSGPPLNRSSPASIGRRELIRNRMIFVCMFIAGCITVSVTAADCRLADTCKTAAAMLVRTVSPGLPPARSTTQPAAELWFAGHSGFQYYMEAAGAAELDDQSPRFRPGDLVIFPVNTYGASPAGHNFEVIGKIDAGPSRAVATMNAKLGAGFYASYGQALPFIFGPIPPESFLVLRVKPGTTISHQ